MAPPTLNRRTLLKAASVSVALPLLESFTSAAPAAGAQAPRRMIAICNALGPCPDYFFPEKAGRDYELTPYLEVLKDFRDSFTVISGLSHPGVNGAHKAEACFLTSAPAPTSPSFHNTISLDQYAVENLKPSTRFPYLALSTSSALSNISLSYTRAGVKIPPYDSPKELFTKMFVNNSPEEIKREISRLKDGHSVLDTVLVQAKRLQGQVSAADRERLDQYFSSLREVEQGLVRAEEWMTQPKPKVSVPPFEDIRNKEDFHARLDLLLRLAVLALETDSTRLITVKIDLTGEYHNRSHHGLNPESLAKLREIEARELMVLRDFVAQLQKSKENDGTLLDRSMVLFGSSLGNANMHTTNNLPILLFGGGFRHGNHLAFDRNNNKPLSNLFVSMLQRLGIEADKFGSSTGTLTGLEST
jgi:uncharacterized protein DUF1552